MIGKVMVKLELCGLYGLNVLRSSKDGKKKKRAMVMLAVWAVLLILLAFYMGGLSYGLIFLGAGEAVPAYLTALSSLLIFGSGLFKADSIIFRREGYDILCALPVPKEAIVASRFVRLYVEDLLMALGVLLPGIAVYIWNVQPEPKVYLAAVVWVLSVPFIPMVGAILIGTVITGISSRMRCKSLAAAGLSILAVLATLYGVSRITNMEGGFDREMLKAVSAYILTLLGKIYPPAVWVGSAVIDGSLGRCFLYAAVSLGITAVAAMGVSFSFHRISRRLYSISGRHKSGMRRSKARPVLSTLCRREAQRYFSSSVYVTNTIIGPVMGCVFSAALLAVGRRSIAEALPDFVDIERSVPFILAAVFCMMTTTATSISMEGKEWWILKSLPLTVKSVLDAKILLNLLLFLPFYILAEILLILALEPGIMEVVWILLIPAVIILFSCVYGITVNLYFPVLDWENEVSVVKQSASAVLGGMGGFVLALLCAVVVAVVPAGYQDICKGGICLAVFGAAVFLYRKDIGESIDL